MNTETLQTIDRAADKVVRYGIIAIVGISVLLTLCYYLEPLLLRWDIHFGFRQFYAALRPAYRIFNYALLALLTLIFLANILSMSIALISLIVIVAAFVAAWYYIYYLNKNGKLQEQRRWVEQIPSLISTLGVLGTFLGITIGLLHFNANDLNASIPHLLEGLKTAFFTSLAGMVGSLVLSRTVSRLFDSLDKGVSDINIAAAQITEAVKTMSDTIVKQSQQQTAVQSAFYNTVNQSLSSLSSGMQTMSGNISQILTLQTAEDSKLNTIAEYGQTIGTTMAETNRNVGEIASITETLASAQNEISAEVKTFGNRLHGEVLEIEESMDKTNQLLTKKFDEFSKLLEKSNTEALVEVMKKVTEEFNRQMSELINKLVQENFEQLNNSVQQLNAWQQENKEMIISLTQQYKEMEKDFERTASTLLNVGEDTQMLVSDGGKLQKIVTALNKVMVDDERFVQMTENLTSSAELTKQSMTEFKDAQTTLNAWVRKQRDFVEAVQALIKQLEDISKINDYSQEFWKETRKGMNDSVAIIRQNSQSLINDIQNLDGHFYNRLNTTLANLDQCIQKMMDNYN